MATTFPAAAVVLVMGMLLMVAVSSVQSDPVLDWLKLRSAQAQAARSLSSSSTSSDSDTGAGPNVDKRHDRTSGRLDELPWREYLNDFVNGYWLHLPKGVLKKSNGWRSRVLPIQTRFAPFGTKILPSSESADSSNTLLRYGRSV